MLVVAAFPEVSVLVAGVASVSRLPVAVSGGKSVLDLLEPFHIDAVLSLSLLFFLSLPLVCFEAHSFTVVPVPCLLSLCCLLVLSLCLLNLFRDFFGSCMIIIGFVVVVVRFCCTYDVFVRTMFGLRMICCSGSSNGFRIVCF